MSNVQEDTRALRGAIDSFMGRAQELGLVQSVGSMAALLVSGTLSERIGPGLVLRPRVVAVASQQQFKTRPFSTAILGDAHLTSPLLVAADVSEQEAIDRSRPLQDESPLPQPQFSILQEVVEVARPKHVEPLDAEFLFQRMTGRLAIGPGTFRDNIL